MIIQQEVTSMFEPKYKLDHDEVTDGARHMGG